MQQAKEQLETVRSKSARMRLRDTRHFVGADLRDVQKLLNRNRKLARAELAKHIPKIVLTPQNGIYLGVGDWRLLRVVSYGGAGARIVCNTHHIPFHFRGASTSDRAARDLAPGVAKLRTTAPGLHKTGKAQLSMLSEFHAVLTGGRLSAGRGRRRRANQGVPRRDREAQPGRPSSDPSDWLVSEAAAADQRDGARRERRVNRGCGASQSLGGKIIR